MQVNTLSCAPLCKWKGSFSFLDLQQHWITHYSNEAALFCLAICLPLFQISSGFTIFPYSSMYSLHGEGISHPSLMTRREEPSIKDEWMEKINDIRVPRSAMNKLIMNYLVTEGFKDAAEKFQEEAGMSPGQNLSLLDNRIRIRDSIQVRVLLINMDTFGKELIIICLSLPLS